MKGPHHPECPGRPCECPELEEIDRHIRADADSKSWKEDPGPRGFEPGS